MKRNISIFIVIVLIFGIFISCSEANTGPPRGFDSDEDATMFGIFTLMMTEMIATEYRTDPQPPMLGMSGTYDGEDGPFSFTFTDFDFSDIFGDPEPDSAVLNGTYTGTVSGTTTTEAWDLLLDIEDVEYSGLFSVKIRIEGNTDLSTFSILHFEINGKGYTEAEIDTYIDS